MEDAHEILTAALAGDRGAVRKLVDRLAPVIWSRVTRVAQRAGRRTPDQIRQLGDDLRQDVFASLFEDGGRVLRSWVQERGLSLEAYVGLVAEHHASSIMRSGRRSAWREDATEDESLARAVGANEAVVSHIDARDTLVRVLERIREELSPKGLQIFELLVVEERPVDEVAEIMSMSADALYAWRSRIGKLAARIARELDPVSESSPKQRTGIEDTP